MVERTRLGSLFGAQGMYVSQSGDSITSPTKALLLDSRFDTYELHQTGRVNIPVLDTNDGIVTYQIEIGFPNLGYVPQFMWGVVTNDGNNIHYPPGVFELGDGTFFYPTDEIAHISSNSLLYRVDVPIPERSLALFYVIYRNPRNPTALAPSGTERVFIGNDAGIFKMRVSKPGYWARSATRDQCTIHEDKRPLIPVASGTVTIPAKDPVTGANGAVNVYTGRTYAFPPKVVCQGASRLGLSSGILRMGNAELFPVTRRYAIYHPQ